MAIAVSMAVLIVSGPSALAAIGKALEARDARAPAGRETWQPMQVARLLAA